MVIYFDMLVSFIAVFVLSYYIMTALQWYSYRYKRLVINFSNPFWHVIYFILPVITYIATPEWFFIYLFIGLIPALFFWKKRVKKTLQFTNRVKKYFLILILLEIINLSLYHVYQFNLGLGSFIVVGSSLIFSSLFEYVMFLKFKSEARTKLDLVKPTIVAITASYGKTSIKNFLYQIIHENLRTYKTPRSVNTIKGLVLDVNRDLPLDLEVYIAEAGAREKGDILEISKFLEHKYAILGSIGPQHIEYFKTIENIIKTKKEILKSPNLQKSFILDDLKDKISNIKSSLNGVEFDLEYHNSNYHFFAPILGKFNAYNIALAIYVARELGVEMQVIQDKVAKLEQIPNRLQKIEVGGKIIIDDSFNSNIDGVLGAIDLVKDYGGRKVIVTPGIIEGNEELNKKVANAIDENFDLAIITGKENKKTLCENINRSNKIYLGDKSKLESILASNTKVGDLILFSSDAPDYI
jgi:UDP-N-acetylmuramoyl-tripeptide--D-alanyl-D-alanine ligase